MYFQVADGTLTYYTRGVGVGSTLEVTPEIRAHMDAIAAYCLTQRTPEQVIIDQTEAAREQAELEKEEAILQAQKYLLDLMEIIEAFVEWNEDTLYKVNDIIRYDNQLYKVIVEHTSAFNTHPNTTPTLYVNITHKADPDNNPQPWAQPLGAVDSYDIDDRVTHKGKLWKSTAANNVWEPGVYGWVEIEE